MGVKCNYTIHTMSIASYENWYLKKHENNEVFGPVHFDKIREWAQSAQVSPQDTVSEDKVVWTKAPMIPELQMDWLVQLNEERCYGPTTVGAILEFLKLGEITGETRIINCCTGEQIRLDEAPFYPKPGIHGAPVTGNGPARRSIRHNLQQRIRELELALAEKNRLLAMAEERIHKLETKVSELGGSIDFR